MTLITIILYITTYLISASGQEHKTAIVVKDTLEYNNEHIEVGKIRQFKRMVHYSNIFIDRTLLIKELLEKESKVIFIVTPRRYGRTTNLFMVKDFLDNSLATKHDNYRLFKFGEYITARGELKILENPLLIEQHDNIINQYQGKYPVVYIHLDDIGGGALDDILKAFRYHIGDVYKEHLYLRKWLEEVALNETSTNPDNGEKAKNDLRRFNDYYGKKSNITELEASISFLCELLFRHFGRRTFVLLDNYDGLMNNVFLRLHFTKMEKAKVEHFFTRFIYETFQNKHIKKGIITGLFHAVRELAFHTITDIEVCTNLDVDIFQFFAFSKREVDALLHHVRIPYELQTQVHQWYNGYKSGKDYSYYHPWSVMKFLGNKVIQNNFEYSRHVQYFVKKFIKYDELANLIRILVEGGNVTVPFSQLYFGKSTFLHLIKMAGRSATPTVYPEVIPEFISFLYSVGLVTFTDFPQDYIGTDKIVSLKIPNLEIEQELSDQLSYLNDHELFE